MRNWWRRGLDRQLTRLRIGGRPAVLWSLRITVAAVASYVAGTMFFPGTEPLLAPLTAMLVVQVTPVTLLASGLDRVVAVVAGVALAVGFAALVPLDWWSLGLLILLSITIGQVLHLRDNLIEVAISAMLVLGVGSLAAEAAAWQRITETLVGAAVGVAVNLLFPPKVASGDAGRAIEALAGSLSELLSRAAGRLDDLEAEGQDLAAATRDWLGEARRINHDIPQVGAALLRAEQGRRLNVRAVGTPDAGPGLRQGLEALEHSAVAIRGMFRALQDALQDARPEDPATDTALAGLGPTFRAMAAGVDAFGHLVREDAEPRQRRVPPDVQELRDALGGLHEARDRLEDLLTIDAAPELLELHAVVLSTVKRLLVEMDLDQRIRRQVRLVRRSRVRQPSPGPPVGRPRGLSDPSAEAETEVLPRVPPNRRDRRRS